MPLPADARSSRLCEGGTPLVESDWLSELTGCRGAAQVRRRQPDRVLQGPRHDDGDLEPPNEGAKVVICASTGNTSASAAAYAAPRRARPAPSWCPPATSRWASWPRRSRTAAGCCSSTGNFDDCLRVARDLSTSYPVALVNSVNPVRIEGQKTAAFEVVDVLGAAPDIHVLPVGNAGNITAYWRGYTEYAATASREPRGCGASRPRAPRRSCVASRSPHPETVASAIRIGNPASWRSPSRPATSPAA